MGGPSLIAAKTGRNQEIVGEISTLVPPEKENPLQHNILQGVVWARQGLNLRPTDYEKLCLIVICWESTMWGLKIVS